MTITQPAGADRAAPIVLRPARVSDMFLLMDLADQVGYCLNPEWIRTRLRAEPGTEAHVVATLQDLLVGAAHVYLSPRQAPGGAVRASVTALAVDEEHRDERIGSGLLARCEELARGMGAHTLEIVIPSRRHEDLRGFWHRHGYARDDASPFVKVLGARP
ncbi:GNAT family N-acetyltransferase [Kocuria sp. KH4]